MKYGVVVAQFFKKSRANFIVIQGKKRHYQRIKDSERAIYKDSIMRILRRNIFCLAILLVASLPALGTWGTKGNNKSVSLAVSACMQGPLAMICQEFSQQTEYNCKLTAAPTGHLYAHVMDGMAYDLLLSSDEGYTQGLINAEKGDPKSRFVLAQGRIVLWSPDPNATPESLHQALMNKQNFTTSIAIANPGSSPYGGAAKEVLQGYNLWNYVQDRLIYGKNSQQTYELVASKRAPLGFVPLSNLSPLVRMRKQYWEPDPNTYKPVLHEILTLKPVQHQEATAAFIAFLHNKESCQILEDAGFSCGPPENVS